jgi:hypothetical protein
MRRQIGIVVLSAIIAVGVIFALFDERINLVSATYQAPSVQTSDK